MLAVSVVAVAPANPAGAAVSWSVGADGNSLTVKVTAGEQVAVRCDGGSVRVTASELTTVMCSALTSLTVNGSALADSIDASRVSRGSFASLGAVVVNGQAGNDRIVGSALGDRILAGTGDDEVLAGAGDDTVQGNAGADRIVGGDGADALSGGDGDDSLTGERDGGVVGDAARDRMLGDDGANVIVAHGLDFIQNSRSDAVTGDDRVVWTFSWVAGEYGSSNNGGEIDIRAGLPAAWVLTGASNCGCQVWRGTSIASGVKVGVNHGNGSSTLRMAGGGSTFTVRFLDPMLFDPTIVHRVLGGAGADSIDVVVADPGTVTVGNGQIRVPGFPTLAYTGVESVTITQA